MQSKPENIDTNDAGKVPSKQPGIRLQQLDFLRGVAILLVLGAHQPNYSAGHLNLVAGLMGRYGWTGVDLFFVLSGFLVGGLIFGEVVKRNSFDARRFMMRRILKIWPMYYLYLCVIIVLIVLKYPSNFWHLISHVIVPSLFHYQNLSAAFYENIQHLVFPMAFTWSLAIEEHFYLALPLLFLLALRMFKSRDRSLSFVASTCLCVMSACLMLRFFLLKDKPFDFFTHLFPTYIRIDSLSFGVFLAYVYHAKPAIWQNLSKYRYLMLTASAILLLPMVLFSHEKVWFVWTFGYTFLYLGYGLLLIVLMQTTVGEGKIGRLVGSGFGKLVSHIGQYSYSIYLWHSLLVVDLLNIAAMHIPSIKYTAPIWLFLMAVSFTMSILVGMLLSRIVEIPTLLLRDRLFPPRVDAVRPS